MTRRFAASSIFVIVLGCLVSACLEFIEPVTTLCPGALYCGSASVPQEVKGGTCCTVVDINFSTGAVTHLPNAAIGYLCAFGSNRAAAGCYATLEQARSQFACPSAPSIVRCERE